MLPKAKVDVKCAMCGLQVHPLVARYLWIQAGWRGRPSPQPHQTGAVTFCGPCGDVFLERVGEVMCPGLLTGGGKT